MEMLTILGLSCNTRNLGLAVVKLDRLVDYSSKLHKQKWNTQKSEMILTSLASCIDAYTIQTLTVSMPHLIHQTPEFTELMNAIVTLTEKRNIEVITYTPEDLLLFIPESKPKSKDAFMKHLVYLYPELQPWYERETANKSKYFYKMFEAIGVATLYSRRIGKWRS